MQGSWLQIFDFFNQVWNVTEEGLILGTCIELSLPAQRICVITNIFTHLCLHCCTWGHTLCNLNGKAGADSETAISGGPGGVKTSNFWPLINCINNVDSNI